MTERCHAAIKYGFTLATRCMIEVDKHRNAEHVGRGLEEFPYQRIEWFEADRRQFRTDRDDAYSWEEPRDA